MVSTRPRNSMVHKLFGNWYHSRCPLLASAVYCPPISDSAGAISVSHDLYEFF